MIKQREEQREEKEFFSTYSSMSHTCTQYITGGSQGRNSRLHPEGEAVLITGLLPMTRLPRDATANSGPGSPKSITSKQSTQICPWRVFLEAFARLRFLLSKYISNL